MKPQDFEIAEIDELISAEEHLLAQKSFPLQIFSEKIQKYLKKTEWVNGSDLSNDLKEITKGGSLNVVIKTLGLWRREALEKKPESTVPKEELEKLEESSERLKEERRESAITASEKQRRWEKLQKQRFLQTPPKDEQERIIKELEGKVVYAEPERPEQQIVLDEHEASTVSAAKINPRVFAEKLSKRIMAQDSDLPENVKKSLADAVSTEATESLISSQKILVPPGAYACLALTGAPLSSFDAKTLEELKKTIILTTIISSSRDELYREKLNKSLGVNLTNRILGFQNTTYKIVSNQTSTSIPIPLDKIQGNSFSFQESPEFDILNNPTFDIAKSQTSLRLKGFALDKLQHLPKTGLLGKISQFLTSSSFDSVAPFLGISTQMTYTGTTFFGKLIITLLPEYAPLITNLTAKLGIDAGIKALAPVVGGAVEKGITATGAKVAGGLISKIGAAIGGLGSFATFGLSTVAGYLLGKLFEKVLNWISRHQNDLKIFGGIILGTGILFQSFPLMIFGGVIFVPTVLRTGLSLGSLSTGTFLFFRRLGKAFAINIAVPVVVFLVVLPVIVALILFIINSGAYIVPPNQLVVSENPYIDVTKTASPEGPFRNSDIPVSITYTITVVAKKGPLANISFKDECKVVKKNSSPDCPSSTLPDPPAEISPSKPFSFSYSVVYGSGTYSDSLITNTLTVTADSQGTTNISTGGSAAIVIGNPPTGCFSFGGGWDNDKKAKETAAISTLSQATTYMATLCSGGNITLTYNPDPTIDYGGEIKNGGITIYHHGLDLGPTGALHTIAHESGHIYAMRTNKYALYLDSSAAASERPICTYPFSPHAASEDFAEMIAIYVAKRAPTRNAACLTNFKAQYPAHWQFARYNIFYEDLGW